MLVQILIIQFITFVGLIFVLRALFLKQLNSALKRLRELEEEALLRESQVKEELERIKQERIAEVQKGKEEAKRLIEQAKKDSETLRSKAESEAKQETQKILSFGNEEVGKLKQELKANLKEESIKLSVEILKYALTEKGRIGLQREFVSEFIQEAEKIEKERFTVKPNKANVITSFALSETEKTQLKNILQLKTGNNNLELIEKIDPEIIAGLIIQMDEFIIDGSLKNKLSKVIPYLNTAV